jgi:isopentenyl diphosphate isomerase/L-lactate dehydrogenase-like FMN-dependent dehydrogenase
MGCSVPEFMNLDEVADVAKAKMTQMAFDYFASGAETQTTVADNRSAFGDYRIVPRILRDVSKVDTSIELFGECHGCCCCCCC